jgi:lipid A oxidase
MAAYGDRMFSRLAGRRFWPFALILTLKSAERAAAFLSIGLLVVQAALPDGRTERDAARTAAGAVGATLASPGRETAFGAYLGAPYHYPSDVTVNKPGAHDFAVRNVEWYTHPFEIPVYYGARIQRWFANGVTGTMIDFTHSKAYAPMGQVTKFNAPGGGQGTFAGKPIPETAAIGDFFKRLEFTHGHNMLTLNGLVRVFGFSNLVQPYAGLGAGISLPHAEVHMAGDPTRTYEYQYTGPNAQALAGLEFRTRAGSLFIEYKFTIADYTMPVTHREGSLLPVDLWTQFSRWWRGDAPPGGWLSTRLTSHQVIGGFIVRFRPAAGAAAAP